MKLCNKVAVINGGQLKAFDSIADLTADRVTLSQYYRRSLALGEDD